MSWNLKHVSKKVLKISLVVNVLKLKKLNESNDFKNEKIPPFPFFSVNGI